MSEAEDEGRAGGTARPAFDAILRPHRSLEPRGFLILMAALCLVSFTAGVIFLLYGAWPVFGFFGLDVAVIYLAFRANYDAARLEERIRIAGDALTVRRIHADGRAQTWSFQPYWVAVDLDEPVTAKSQLRLRSHGRSLVIGAFLTPAERKEVAVSLRAALAPLQR